MTPFPEACTTDHEKSPIPCPGRFTDSFRATRLFNTLVMRVARSRCFAYDLSTVRNDRLKM